MSHEPDTYDFSRPVKLNRDQLRDLHGVFRTFARNCSISMAGDLRWPVEVTLASIDQVPWREATQSIPESSMFARLVIGKQPAPAMIVAENAFVEACIDRMLGGSGMGKKRKRPLTDVDESLALKMLDHWSLGLEREWQRLGNEEQFVLEGVEQRSVVETALPANEVTVRVICTVEQGRREYAVEILIPYSAVADSAGLLGGRFGVLDARTYHDNSNEPSLGSVPVGVAAVGSLGHWKLATVASLAAGQRIALPDGWSRELVLMSRNQPLLAIAAGLSGDRRIASVIGPAQPVPDPVTSSRGAGGLSQARVHVTFEYGTRQVPMRELVSLSQVGSLRLDERADSPVVIRVAGEPVATAHLGRDDQGAFWLDVVSLMDERPDTKAA